MTQMMMGAGSSPTPVLGDGQTEFTPHYQLNQLNYPQTNGTPVLRWIIVGTSNDPAVAYANGNVKQIYVKNHGDGWYWACSHTFGGGGTDNNSRPTTNDDYTMIKAGFWASESHGDQYHIDNPSWSTQSGTMAPSKQRNCHLRFSNSSNGWQSGPMNGNFWAVEPDGSATGSSSNFMLWWAHSSNEGRLHIYGNISGKVPSSVTHWHEAEGNYGGGSSYGYHAHHDGNNNGSRRTYVDHSYRCTLGTLSSTGSHGFIQDGNGNTNKNRSLWMGHS